VVEHERLIADFVGGGLETCGYRGECAFDGVDGEPRALSDDVDLVILDGMLPGRDGLEVLAAIRAHKTDLPVLVLTGNTEGRDRAAALGAGATGYLVRSSPW